MLHAQKYRAGRGVVTWLCLALLLAVLPAITHAAAPTAQGTARKVDNPASLTPATPQDAALAQAVKTRLAAWGDPHVDSLPRTTAPGQTTGLPFDDGSRTTPARGAASRPDAQASTKTGCTLCGVAIDARNGNVRLSGKVRTSEQRAAAEDIARGIPGVRSVTNAIVVGP